MTEGYPTEQSPSRLRIIDLETKAKLQRVQVAEKDREISSWKRKQVESIQAQKEVIESRYEAFKAQDGDIKARDEAIKSQKEIARAQNEVSKINEIAMKDLQRLQEDYDELWRRSDAIIKEKIDTFNDVKTTTKRKNNEVLVRMSNGEKVSRLDEEWIQSHRSKCQGKDPRRV